jgi:hypothetical protein
MPELRIKKLGCANLAFTIPVSAELRDGSALRHKENLVSVRILHFSAGRESFHIDIFTR